MVFLGRCKLYKTIATFSSLGKVYIVMYSFHSLLNLQKFRIIFKISPLDFTKIQILIYSHDIMKEIFTGAIVLTLKVLITQSCPTLCYPMDCSPPSSSVHGILQARILEWVHMPSSRESSRPRDPTQVSCIADRCFTIWVTWEAPTLK